MIVYRITKSPYQKDLSGMGAKLYGGRWNSKGIPLIYCSESRVLAYAEVAIHLPLHLIPKDYYLISLRIPANARIQTLKPHQLPANWRSFPHSKTTQQLGDRFVKFGRYLVLRVPSAVVPGDYNLLINPLHPMAQKIVITRTELFEFDERWGKESAD